MDTAIPAFLCVFFVLIFFMMIFLSASIRIVREDTRLSVYRLGRYLGDKGPGLVILIPIIDRGEVKKMGDSSQGHPGRMYVGGIGETVTPVFRDGRVLFSSGEWDAVSQMPIAAGKRVRVVKMILEVEEESSSGKIGIAKETQCLR